MRVAELAQREPILESVASVVSDYLSDGPEGATKRGSEGFRYLRYFSAIASWPPSEQALRYLRLHLRFSNRVWKGLWHAAAARALSTRWLLPIASEPMQSNGGPRGTTRSLLILPGNQRIRILDFDRGRSVAVTKPGFSNAGSKRAIDVRSGNSHGFLVPILDVRHDARWIEEPLITGFALSRAYPWERRRLDRVALDSLLEWRAGHRRPTATSPYVDGLRQEMHDRQQAIAQRFGPSFVALPSETLERWVRLAKQRSNIATTLTHGDFQAGNVLVTEDGREVKLIDWEDSGWRSGDYDLFTWGLGARSIQGLATRISGALRTGGLRGVPPEALWADVDRAAMALFLMEDAHLRLETMVSGTFMAVPRDWDRFVREISRLGRL